MSFSGDVIYKGISFGNALIINYFNISIINYIDKKDIDIEIKRFYIGYNKTINELKNIVNRCKLIFGNEEELIFEYQILILEDINFIKNIEYLILNKLYKSEYAVFEVIFNKLKYIKKIGKTYINIDLKDICNRLINNICNKKIFILEDIDENVILVLHNFFLSYVIQINFNKISGIIIENCNFKSHSLIILRSLQIPSITNIKNITKLIKNNDYIILDSINNNIYVNPKSEIITDLNKKSKKYINYFNKLIDFSKKDSITLDNYKINLYININNIHELNNLNKYTFDGIGLFRTELFFLNFNKFPNEKEQYIKYKELLSYLDKNKIITIRIFNIINDEKINNKYFFNKKNINSKLEGIKFLLKNKNILHNQLKAILRVSKFNKNIRIMYPMISSYEEICDLKKELIYVKDFLYKNNIIFNKDIKIGMMIEIPSSVFLLHHFIKDIDFFSIGSNDLTNFLLAINRYDINNSFQYNYLHPSVIIFIKNIINIINKFNKEIYICGDFAENERFLPLLLGLGIKSLSVNINSILNIKESISKYRININSILNIKESISKLDLYNTKIIADNILCQSKLDDVIKILNNINK